MPAGPGGARRRQGLTVAGEAEAVPVVEPAWARGAESTPCRWQGRVAGAKQTPNSSDRNCAKQPGDPRHECAAPQRPHMREVRGSSPSSPIARTKSPANGCAGGARFLFHVRERGRRLAANLTMR